MSPSHAHRELSEEDHKVPYPYVASMEDLKAHQVPVGWRDMCSGHIIPLRQCFAQTMYVPWKCHAEKSRWEICQYKDFLRRMRKATRLKLEARQNGTGPVPYLEEVMYTKQDTLNAVLNQDQTPGPTGPYDYVPLRKGAGPGAAQ